MKSLVAASYGAAALGGLTKEDWLFILSIVIGLLNLVVEYLKSRPKETEKEPESPD